MEDNIRSRLNRNIGPSIEILKIMSAVPNYEEKCVLCGEGVLGEDCQTNEAQE